MSLGQLLGRRLAAQLTNGGWRRAYPDQPCILHRLRKACILTQKAITWVHCIRRASLCCSQQLAHIQIALRRRQPPQCVSLRGLLHMQTMGIRIGIHGHGFNSHAMGRGHDAQRNLAAIGNQNALHRSPPAVTQGAACLLAKALSPALASGPRSACAKAMAA